MSYNVQIWDFPALAVQSQLFYAGGAAIDGGFTSGGARTISPEPGGRAFLEVQLSLQVNEWDIPFSSWIMSKINNGNVFRVPLTRTPQLVSDITLDIPTTGPGKLWASEGAYPVHTWDNGQPWASDGAVFEPVFEAYDGETQISVTGQIFKYGHVFGIGDVSYIVDDIEYSDDGLTSLITVNPPLRADLTDTDLILTRPYFLGTVSNASEVRQMYDRTNNGHIAPGRLLFSEFIP